MKKIYHFSASRTKKMNRKGLFSLLFVVIAAVFMVIAPQNSYAQGKRISIDFTEMPMKDVILEVEKLSGYNFLYNSQLINLNYNVTINKKNIDIRELLDELFRSSDINYKIVDKQVILSPKDSSADPNKPSQTKSGKKIVRGVVTDKSGQALFGCAVTVKGTNIGTVTGADGSYEIAYSSDSPLIFNYVGMKSQEVKPTSTQLNVQMELGNQTIDQVVVTGYQTFNKYNTTGSVNTLSAKEIDMRSSVSLERMLEGTVPGLTVYRGDYRIRGGSSLNAGTKPLFIVDDFEVESLPENMDMVENITVLKDAAASAIWGSRAANGVIVITTKRGKIGDFRISYSNNFKISGRPDFDDLYRANSAEQISYEREVYGKEMYFDGLWEDRSGYSQSLGVIRDHSKGLITDDIMNSRLDSLGGLSNRDQINDYLLRNAFKQNHLISISGATEKVNYYLSGSFNTDRSNYIGDRSTSANINSRTSYKLLDFITLRADINATFGTDNKGYTDIESDVLALNPYQMIKDAQGNYIYDYKDFNKESNDYLMSVGLYDQGLNILNEVNLANNKSTTTAYKVRVGADFNIIEGLNASVDFQKERIGIEDKNVRAKNSSYAANEINRLTSIGANNVLTHNLPNGDMLDAKSTTTDAWVLKAGVTLNRTFGQDKKHYVNAIVGYEARQRVTTSESRRKLGYDDQLLSWQPINQVLLEKTGVDGYFGNEKYFGTSYDKFGYNDSRETSAFGSAVYTYDNRYTVSASFRFDESNLFGADKKFRRNPIYSVGANWNIANESFFNSSVVNDLILRATYGMTGNFDRSGSTTPIMVGSRSYLSSVNGYVTRINTPPNPLLRWEKTRNTNVSLQIGLFDRLNATVDVYSNYSKDLLGEQTLDPTVGFAKAKINAADMKNKGVEIALNGDIIRTRDFNWNASIIWAYNNNKIINNKIADGAPELNRVTGTTKFVEGYAREALWSYRWAGLDDMGNPMVYGVNGEKIYKAVLESLISTGTYQPKYNGSFSTGFRYKTITLNLMFVYNFGHFYRMGYPEMDPMNEPSGSLNKMVADRWTETNKNTEIPSMPTWETPSYQNGRERATQYSTNSLRSGDFVRLREILLNYELPNTLLQKTPFKRISLTAQLNNLWLWAANKEKMDPEAIEPINGGFSFREPMSVTFGIKLDF